MGRTLTVLSSQVLFYTPSETNPEITSSNLIINPSTIYNAGLSFEANYKAYIHSMQALSDKITKDYLMSVAETVARNLHYHAADRYAPLWIGIPLINRKIPFKVSFRRMTVVDYQDAHSTRLQQAIVITPIVDGKHTIEIDGLVAHSSTVLIIRPLLADRGIGKLTINLRNIHLLSSSRIVIISDEDFLDVDVNLENILFFARPSSIKRENFEGLIDFRIYHPTKSTITIKNVMYKPDIRLQDTYTLDPTVGHFIIVHDAHAIKTVSLENVNMHLIIDPDVRNRIAKHSEHFCLASYPIIKVNSTSYQTKLKNVNIHTTCETCEPREFIDCCVLNFSQVVKTYRY